MLTFNYKSDFSFFLTVSDGNGQPLGWPSNDIKLIIDIWTSSRPHGVKAIIENGVGKNCRIVKADDETPYDRILIIADNHKLSPGQLNCEVTAEIPNGLYDDATRKTVWRGKLDIMLVELGGDFVSDGIIPELGGATLPIVIIDAYELARRQGYEGTREEYISASINLVETVKSAAATLQQSQEAAREAKSASSEATQMLSNATAAVNNAIEATAGANTAALQADLAAQNAREAAAAANTVNNLTEQSLADLTEAMASLDDVPRLGSENHFRAEQHFDGGLTASAAHVGSITVDGDFIHTGDEIEHHAEKVYSRNDEIILREGAVDGLAPNKLAGLRAEKYNGHDDGFLGFGRDGIARVGDAGDEQPLLTRDEAANIPDGAVFVWDASSNCAKGLNVRVVEMEATFEADDDHEEDYTETFLILCRNEI